MSQVLSLVLVLKQQFFKFSFIELINEKSQTNRDQKPNLFFYNNMINFEFRIKLVKKWQKTLQRDQYLIYRIQYNYKIADCENIHSLNPLYLPVNQGSGYIEENNGNKYLIFDDSGDENKEVLKKYVDVWNGIESEIQAINSGKENDYGKEYIKIKFSSDNDLPLNKSLKFHAMAIIIRSVFEEDGKLYPQVFLDDAFYEL